MEEQLKAAVEKMVEGLLPSYSPDFMRAQIEPFHTADLDSNGSITGSTEQVALLEAQREVNKTLADVSPTMRAMAKGTKILCEQAATKPIQNGIDLRENLSKTLLNMRPLSNFFKTAAAASAVDASPDEIASLSEAMVARILPTAEAGAFTEQQQQVIITAIAPLVEKQVAVLKENSDLYAMAATIPDTTEMQPLPYEVVCKALTGSAPGKAL